MWAGLSRRAFLRPVRVGPWAGRTRMVTGGGGSPRARSSCWRRWSAALALVAGYARQTVVNSDQFANRATEALRDDSVKSLIAEKITDEVVLKNKADLVAARPLIESVASDIVGGRAFTELFRKAVRDVHRSLFKHDKDTVTLTIADVGTVLAAALQQVRPDLADAGRLERAGGGAARRHRQPQRHARRHRRADPAAGALPRDPGAGAGGRRAVALARPPHDGDRARPRARRGRRA